MTGQHILFVMRAALAEVNENSTSAPTVSHVFIHRARCRGRIRWQHRGMLPGYPETDSSSATALA